MKLYRVGRTKYASDRTGEGARLHGGRWNHKMIPCIYTSESRALAILEYSVNSNMDDIPQSLSVTIYEVPDKACYSCKLSDLPEDWSHTPSSSSTRDYGSALLKKGNYLVSKVPSAIVPEEYNYLINPLHKDIDLIKVADIASFIYDTRIKKG